MASNDNDNIKDIDREISLGNKKVIVKVSKNDIKREEQMLIIIKVAELISIRTDCKMRVEKSIHLENSNKVSCMVVSFFNFYEKSLNMIRDQKLKDDFEKQKSLKVIDNNDLTYEDLLNYIKANCPNFSKYDFQFSTPLLNWMTAFELAFDEVGLGTTKWLAKVEKNNPVNHSSRSSSVEPGPKRKKMTERSETAYKSITDFGLNCAAIPFLTGATYKPERRFGLLSTMGILTLAIMLFKEKQYIEEIKNALYNAIKHIPIAKDLVENMSRITCKDRYKKYLKVLNRALVVTDNQAVHKAYFPLACFIEDWPYTIFDFSEKGMYYFYFTAVNEQTYIIKSGSDNIMIPKQLIFHSIFKSHIGDLSMLAQITDCGKWYTRSEMNNHYDKALIKEVNVIGLINFKKISKLKSGDSIRSDEIPSCNIDFAKFQRREVFLDVPRQLGDYQVLSYMNTYIKKFVIRIEECGGYIDSGTSSWYEGVNLGVNGLEWVNEDKNLQIEGKGEYFY